MTPDELLAAVEAHRADAGRETTPTDDPLLRDYAGVFGSEAGQRVLVSIERAGHVGRTALARPMPGTPVDVSQTIWNDGARSLALEIRARYERGRLLGTRVVETKAARSLTEDA